MRYVWYVTRKYPPSVGGMQRLAGQIAMSLRARGSAIVLAWGGSQAGLPLFAIWAALRILWGRMRGDIGVLYLGDPILSGLALLVRGTSTRIAVTVHGLDVLYPNRLYQVYLRRCFWGKFDTYIAISSAVAELLRARGIAPERVAVAPPGIDLPNASPPDPRKPTAAPVLLALGRLVPRKGLAWFVDAVAPQIFARHPAAMLVIAGDGPARASIVAAIRRQRLAGNVEMRGSVDDPTKQQLLARCDAVIMPNIPIPGDFEGFGLVALEAGAASRPVFAADLEGLRDAVREGENGWRLPAADATRWARAIGDALDDIPALRAAGERAYACVRAHYRWDRGGERYAEIVERLARR